MGERLPENYSLHHLNYTRRSFTTKLQKALRCQSGLIVPCHDVNHRLLHWRIRPLDAPSNWLCKTLTDIAVEQKNIERLQAAFNVTDELGIVAEEARSPEQAQEALRYHSYLFEQLEIVTMPVAEARSFFSEVA